MDLLGIIAGNGHYPLHLARAARQQGVKRIVMTAFEGETRPEVAALADEVEWMRVGQLGRMLRFFESRRVPEVVMAGQIAPGNLFDLRPDLKALMILARLKERNAESIFGAIADELGKVGVRLHEATLFLEEWIPSAGHVAGAKLSRRAKDDVAYGFRMAKEMSRLDVGQSVLIKKGTVVAVEAFEGTNAAMRRGGELGKGGVVLVKVSKPNQDMRFDVPIIGAETLRVAAEAGVSVVAGEAGMTLWLELNELKKMAEELKISLVAAGPEGLI